MSNGLLSFAGGLAKGYMDNTVRNQELERQAKLDAMREEEFNLRKEGLQMDLEDKKRTRTDAQALRDSQAPVAPVDEWSQDVSGQTPEDQQATAERMSTGEDMGQAGVNVAGKSFLKTPAGLADAQKFATQTNSPDARAERYAKTLTDQGKASEAADYMAKWTDHKTKIYDAQREALWKTIAPMAASGDRAGLTDAYSHFKDGKTLAFQDNPDGTSTAVQKDASGKPVGTFTFKGNDELQNKIYEALFSDKVAEQRRAAAAAQALENNKVHTVAPGASLVKNGGQALYTNPNKTSADARIEAALLKGAGGGKPVGPAIETLKTDTGSYLYDKNSGAIGTIVPASDAVPGKSHWFSPDEPGTPSAPNRVEWKTADGAPLPGGPQTLYSQLPVNKQPGAAPAAKAPVKVATKAERDALPEGTVYVGPDGVARTRK